MRTHSRYPFLLLGALALAAPSPALAQRASMTTAHTIPGSPAIKFGPRTHGGGGRFGGGHHFGHHFGGHHSGGHGFHGRFGFGPGIHVGLGFGHHGFGFGHHGFGFGHHGFGHHRFGFSRFHDPFFFHSPFVHSGFGWGSPYFVSAPPLLSNAYGPVVVEQPPRVIYIEPGSQSRGERDDRERLRPRERDRGDEGRATLGQLLRRDFRVQAAEPGVYLVRWLGRAESVKSVRLEALDKDGKVLDSRVVREAPFRGLLKVGTDAEAVALTVEDASGVTTTVRLPAPEFKEMAER